MTKELKKKGFIHTQLRKERENVVRLVSGSGYITYLAYHLHCHEAERNATAQPTSCFLLSPVPNDECWRYVSIQLNFSGNIFMGIIKEGVFSKHSKSK